MQFSDCNLCSTIDQHSKILSPDLLGRYHPKAASLKVRKLVKREKEDETTRMANGGGGKTDRLFRLTD